MAGKDDVVNLSVAHAQVEEIVAVLLEPQVGLVKLVAMHRGQSGFGRGGHGAVPGIESEKQGLHGGKELRTIEAGERFILFDITAGGIGKGLGNPPVDRRVNLVGARLVHSYPAQKPEFVMKRRPLDAGNAHADQLLLLRTHLHRPRRQGGPRGSRSGGGCGIGEDGFHLHAARRPARLIRCMRRVHRINVIEDLPGVGCGFGIGAWTAMPQARYHQKAGG